MRRGVREGGERWMAGVTRGSGGRPVRVAPCALTQRQTRGRSARHPLLPGRQRAAQNSTAGCDPLGRTDHGRQHGISHGDYLYPVRREGRAGRGLVRGVWSSDTGNAPTGRDCGARRRGAAHVSHMRRSGGARCRFLRRMRRRDADSSLCSRRGAARANRDPAATRGRTGRAHRGRISAGTASRRGRRAYRPCRRPGPGSARREDLPCHVRGRRDRDAAPSCVRPWPERAGGRWLEARHAA
jgi:hypothetical protein